MRAVSAIMMCVTRHMTDKKSPTYHCCSSQRRAPNTYKPQTIVMTPEKRKAPDDEADEAKGGSGAKLAAAKPIALRPQQRQSGISFNMGDTYYRGLYKHDPDFRQLAQLDADFSSQSVSHKPLPHVTFA